ncbi:MAG: hypothetical protein LPK79_11500 [Bacteroidota bacterium]|nr:hypothetical protein [Bacteroidota bacterium]MDX5428712.1 hypothetical protein [Bacteroidota bacterium]
MRKKPHIPLLLLLSALFLSSLGGCKKEEASYPIVEIFTPASGSFFSVPDTIPVRARVADKDLRSVTVTLVDEDYRPIGETASVSVKNNDFTFDLNYPILDPRINTGQYFIRIIASNNENTTRTYHDIRITGLPRRSRGWLVASNSGLSPASIGLVDSVGNLQALPGYPGPISKLVASSYMRRYILCPYRLDDLFFRSTSDHSMLSSHTFLHPADYPVIRCADGDDQVLFAASADGRMFTFNEMGYSSTFPLEPGFEPMEMKVHEDGILMAMIQRNPIRYSIQWIRRTNGFVFSEAPILSKPMAICTGNSGRFFLFTNENGSGKVHLYQLGDALTTPLASPVFPEILTAISVGSEQFVISTTAGLYFFQFNPGNSYPLTGQAGGILAFDEERSVLLSADKATLFTYQWPSMQPGPSYIMQDSIADLQVLYNK